jgi:aminoglycoside phosphotransferase (APT) family kinase protein
MAGEVRRAAVGVGRVNSPDGSGTGTVDGWLALAASTSGRRIVRGIHNSVVLVAERFVVKVYGDVVRAANERAALDALDSTSIEAPRVLAHELAGGPTLAALGVSAPAGPAPVTVLSWVPGRPLAASRVTDLAPVLHRLYAVEPPAVGRLTAPEPAGWRAYLCGRIDDYETTLVPHRGRPRRTGDLIGWLRDGLPAPPGRRSLLHNDLSVANAVRWQRRVVLLDWEAAIGGDPLLDLARLWFRTPTLDESAVLDLHDRVAPVAVGRAEARCRLRFYFGFHLLATDMVARISTGGDLAAVRADVERGYARWTGFARRTR